MLVGCSATCRESQCVGDCLPTQRFEFFGDLFLSHGMGFFTQVDPELRPVNLHRSKNVSGWISLVLMYEGVDVQEGGVDFFARLE